MTSSLTPVILFEEQSAVLRLRFCTLDFLNLFFFSGRALAAHQYDFSISIKVQVLALETSIFRQKTIQEVIIRQVV